VSKGLGRIERAILDKIAWCRASQTFRELERGGPVLVRTWHLMDCYRPLGWSADWSAEHKHRQAITRAMHAFVSKYPEYALTGGKGRQELFLYEPGDPISVRYAEMTMQNGFVSLSEVFADMRAT